MLSGCPGGPPESDDPHGRMAEGALEDRPGTWGGRFNQDPQNQLDEGQQFFGVAVEEPVVPDPAEAFG